MKKRYVGEGGRYAPRSNDAPRLTLTGRVYLKYEDEEAMAAAATGDLLLFLNTDNQSYPQTLGDYHRRGQAGYFRIDVFEGKRWQPASAADFFPGREHHFSKSERAIDTYRYCAELLAAFAGRSLARTYREHYSLQDEEPAKEP